MLIVIKAGWCGQWPQAQLGGPAQAGNVGRISAAVSSTYLALTALNRVSLRLLPKLDTDDVKESAYILHFGEMFICSDGAFVHIFQPEASRRITLVSSTRTGGLLASIAPITATVSHNMASHGVALDASFPPP